MGKRLRNRKAEMQSVVPAMYAAFGKELTRESEMELRKRNKGEARNFLYEHESEPRIAQLLRDYGRKRVLQALRYPLKSLESERERTASVARQSQLLIADEVFPSTRRTFREYQDFPFETTRRTTREQVDWQKECQDVSLENTRCASYGYQDLRTERLATRGDNPVNDASQHNHGKGYMSLEVGHPGTMRKKHTDSAASYPKTSIPIEVQHRLLTKVQSLLEQACYDFAYSTMGNTLERRDLSCAEAVELNMWPKIFNTASPGPEMRDGHMTTCGRYVRDIYKSMIRLRHVTVHRQRISTEEIEMLIKDGEALCELMQRENVKMEIAPLRASLQLAIAEIEQNTISMDEKLAAIRETFDAHRATLAQLERGKCEEVQAEIDADVRTSAKLIDDALMLKHRPQRIGPPSNVGPTPTRQQNSTSHSTPKLEYMPVSP